MKRRGHLGVAAALGVGVAALLLPTAGSQSTASALSPLPAESRLAGASIPRGPAPVATSAGQMPHAPGLRRFTAAIGAELSDSLLRSGVPGVAARDYVTQMLRVANLATELSVDDRFDLIVASTPGEPPVLVYAGMDRVGRGDLQFLKYGDDRGRVEWVDARGLERRESGGFVLPVGGRVTSGYGTRMHPLLGSARFHRGIDLAAASGTPIKAAADGRVVRVGWRGGYGRQVALAHDGGLDTSYSHLSRILARPGEQVERGQVIGLVGSSGLSTGPHLHFEAARNGKPIDPRSARIEMPVAMDKSQRDAFNGQSRFVLTAVGA